MANGAAARGAEIDNRAIPVLISFPTILLLVTFCYLYHSMGGKNYYIYFEIAAISLATGLSYFNYHKALKECYIFLSDERYKIVKYRFRYHSWLVVSLFIAILFLILYHLSIYFLLMFIVVIYYIFSVSNFNSVFELGGVSDFKGSHSIYAASASNNIYFFVEENKSNIISYVLLTFGCAFGQIFQVLGLFTQGGETIHIFVAGAAVLHISSSTARFWRILSQSDDAVELISGIMPVSIANSKRARSTLSSVAASRRVPKNWLIGGLCAASIGLLLSFYISCSPHPANPSSTAQNESVKPPMIKPVDGKRE